MKILYWDCPYQDYEEYGLTADGEDVRVYGCKHPENPDRACLISNQYIPADCELLDRNGDYA